MPSILLPELFNHEKGSAIITVCQKKTTENVISARSTLLLSIQQRFESSYPPLKYLSPGC